MGRHQSRGPENRGSALPLLKAADLQHRSALRGLARSAYNGRERSLTRPASLP